MSHSLNSDVRDELLRQGCRDIELAVLAGKDSVCESILDSNPEFPQDDEALLELIYTEFVTRVDRGESVSEVDLQRRFPHLADRLQRLLAVHDFFSDADGNEDGDTHPVAQLEIGTDGQYASTMPEVAPGDLLDGRYEVLETIDEGAKGVVCRAWQPDLDRFVAIKFLKASLRHAEEKRRFEREARAAAGLKHPNIVEVYDVGDDDGRPFICMELIEQGNLDKLIRSNSVSIEEAVSIVQLIANAMHFAHSNDVVHRDLKPANILLTKTGTPKVTDFGLAKTSQEEHTLTRTGAVMGTPCYMAPEQATGKSGDVDARSDVYALGGILYALLTGRPPFLGDSELDVFDAVRHQEPVAPSRLRTGIPKDVENITLKCLSKEPSKRYHSAEQLAEDLQRFLDNEPVTARRTSMLEQCRKWCRRKPLAASLGLALCVAVTASLVTISSLLIRSEHLRSRAEAQSERAIENEEEAIRAKLASDEQAAEAIKMARLAEATALSRFSGLSVTGTIRPLETIAEFYKGQADQAPEDETLWFNRVKVAQQLGKTQAAIGNFGASETQFAEGYGALAHLETLDEKYKFSRAAFQIEHARLFFHRYENTEADERLKEAETFLVQHLETNNYPQARLYLSRASRIKGWILYRQERYAEAHKTFNQALEHLRFTRPNLIRPLPKSERLSPPSKRQSGTRRFNITALRPMNKVQTARPSGQSSESKAIQSNSSKSSSMAAKNLSVRPDLRKRLLKHGKVILPLISGVDRSDIWGGIALSARELRNLKEAEEYALKSLSPFKNLSQRNAEVDETRYQFIRAQRGYARVLRSLKRYDESEKQYKNAIEDARRLYGKDGRHSRYKEAYAEVESDYAALLWRMKRYQDAAKHYEISSTLWRELAEQTGVSYFRDQALIDFNEMGVNLRLHFGI